MFAGVGERTREGDDFYHEMIESGVNKDPHKGSVEGAKNRRAEGDATVGASSRPAVGPRSASEAQGSLQRA